jgi:carbonic anhydrase
MLQARPLPAYLVTRYRGWRATRFADNSTWYRHLVEDGQHPRAMVITCCDSRVTPVELFGADPGEFFIHRNIANLVPPVDASGQHKCTLAAVDYAVSVLRVTHLVVMGHSHCGGVKGCLDMCTGAAPALEGEDSAVGRWLDVLRPAYARTRDIASPAERQAAMEHQGVLISLANLLTYPSVSAAVAEGRLTLHGIWKDLADGVLHQYDPEQDSFVQV